MKKILIFILCLCLCFTATGCYGGEEISKLAFVIAIGIDKEDKGLYNYTFQIVKPSAFEEGSEDNPLVSNTVTSSTVYSAMDKLNSEISEKCDYSHIKLAVLSDSLLKEEGTRVFEIITRSDFYHPNIRIALSKGKAGDYLNSIKIPLDTNPVEYYENLFRESYSPYSPQTRLKDIPTETGGPPVCNILSLVEPQKAKDEEKDIGTQNLKEIAILKDGKFVATGDENYAKWYNLLTGKSTAFNIVTTATETKEEVVVKLSKKQCTINVQPEKNGAKIKVDLAFDGNVLWSESNLLGTEVFAQKVQGYVKEQVEKFLQICSQKYKADVVNFGKYARAHYLTENAWQNEDWQTMFERAEYTVNVNVDIKREGINYK